MIDFAFKETGLSPHHYVEFKNNPLSLGLTGQPQRLLLLRKSTSSMRFVRDASREEVFSQEVSLVRALNPSLEVCGLLYGNSLEESLSSLPEIPFTQMVLLEKDPEGALLTILADFLEARWVSPLELDGHLFFAQDGEAKISGEELARQLDSPHVSLFLTGDSPTPAAEWALTIATLNGGMAHSPQKPYTGVLLTGVSPPGESPKLAARNQLLKSGVSTFVANGARVFLDRLVTTSQAQDRHLSDLNSKQILSLLRFDLKQYFGGIFRGMSLAKDHFPYSGDVITPKAATALAISRFRKWQEMNLVQDKDERFAKDIRVEVDENTHGKLNFFLPITLMGQLYITQTQIHFSL